MSFRPFRSLVFWLGWPGLLFLLWAWVDSMSHRSGVFVKEQFAVRTSVTIMNFVGHENAGVRLEWGDEQKPAGVRSRFAGFQLHRSPRTGPAGSLFPAPSFKALPRLPVPSGRKSGVGWSILVLPIWLLVALYLAVWWGLLTWRQRVRRAAERKASALPGAAAA